MTTNIWRTTTSSEVDSDQPVICEHPMYFDFYASSAATTWWGLSIRQKGCVVRHSSPIIVRYFTGDGLFVIREPCKSHKLIGEKHGPSTNQLPPRKAVGIAPLKNRCDNLPHNRHRAHIAEPSLHTTPQKIVSLLSLPPAHYNRPTSPLK